MVFEWRRSGSLQKQIEDRADEIDGDNYGAISSYDRTPPARSESFEGLAQEWADVQDLIDIANTPAHAAGDAGKALITDHLGQQWRGPILSLKWDLVAGSECWRVSLELHRPVIVTP